MKQLVQVTEIENEGLVSLMGQTVTFFCLNYIYVGKLVGVNSTFIKLENTHIVYETGAWISPKFTDAQRLPNSSYYIQTAAIESFGVTKDL
jgi:hypothetical protein